MCLYYLIRLPTLKGFGHPDLSVFLSNVLHVLVVRLAVDYLLNADLIGVLGVLSHIDERAEVVVMDMGEEPTCYNDIVGIISKLLKCVVEPLCGALFLVITLLVFGDTTVYNEELAVGELINVAHTAGISRGTDTDNGKRRICKLLVDVVILKTGKIVFVSVVNGNSGLSYSVKIHYVYYLYFGKEGSIVVVTDLVFGISNKSVQLEIHKEVLILGESGVLCDMHYRGLTEIDISFIKCSTIVLGKLDIVFEILNVVSVDLSGGKADIPIRVDNYLSGICSNVSLYLSSYSLDELNVTLNRVVRENVLAVDVLRSSCTCLDFTVELCRLCYGSFTDENSGSVCAFSVKVCACTGHLTYCALECCSESCESVQVVITCLVFSYNLYLVLTVSKNDEAIGVGNIVIIVLSGFFGRLVGRSVSSVGSVCALITCIVVTSGKSAKKHYRYQQKRDQSDVLHNFLLVLCT